MSTTTIGTILTLPPSTAPPAPAPPSVSDSSYAQGAPPTAPRGDDRIAPRAPSRGMPRSLPDGDDEPHGRTPGQTVAAFAFGLSAAVATTWLGALALHRLTMPRLVTAGRATAGHAPPDERDASAPRGEPALRDERLLQDVRDASHEAADDEAARDPRRIARERRANDGWIRHAGAPRVRVPPAEIDLDAVARVRGVDPRPAAHAEIGAVREMHTEENVGRYDALFARTATLAAFDPDAPDAHDQARMRAAIDDFVRRNPGALRGVGADDADALRLIDGRLDFLRQIADRPSMDNAFAVGHALQAVWAVIEGRGDGERRDRGIEMLCRGLHEARDACSSRHTAEMLEAVAAAYPELYERAAPPTYETSHDELLRVARRVMPRLANAGDDRVRRERFETRLRDALRGRPACAQIPAPHVERFLAEQVRPHWEIFWEYCR